MTTRSLGYSYGDVPRAPGNVRVAPAILTLPSISGNTPSGSTLTRTAGTYRAYPSATVAGQWKAAGVPISGETGATYVTTAADEGKAITYHETATNTYGEAEAETLAIVVDVSAPSSSTPTINTTDATTYNANTATTSFSITTPANLTVDNSLVIIAVDAAPDPTNGLDAHADFSLVADFFDATADMAVGVYVRVIDGTEAASYTITSSAGTANRLIGWAFEMEGTHTTLASIVNVLGSIGGTGNATSHVAPEVTTTADNCRVLTIFAFDGSDGGDHAVTGTGWTEVVEIDGGNTAGNAGYSTLVVAQKEQATAGATGDCTISSDVSDGAIKFQIAFAPTTTGGGTEDAGFPPLIGTLTPGNNDASAGTPGPSTTPSPDWAGATVYNANVNASSFVIDKPACSVGDTLFLIAACGGTNPSVDWDTVSGFTEIVGSASATSDIRLSIQQRVVDGTEAASFTVSQTATAGSVRQIGLCVRVPGCNTSGPTEAIGTPKIFSNTSAHTVTQTTTTDINRRVLSVFCFFGTDGAPVTTSGTDWTEQKVIYGGNTSGNGGYAMLVVADKDQAAAGATGNVSHTTAVADRGVSLQFAIVPEDVTGDGDAISGYRDNGSDPDVGSVTGGPFDFAELWVRKTGTPYAVDDIRLGSQLPLAKINSKTGVRVALKDTSDGTALGPVVLPWSDTLNRYGTNLPGAADFITAREGQALNLYYEEIEPAGGSGPRFEGHGATATGGEGGAVVYVTNSNDSGTGSFRWACETLTGARNILFKVNQVNLTSGRVTLASSNVSIYGQTAGGVEVRGATMKVYGSNIIIQGMMFRPGDDLATDPNTDRDCLSIGVAETTAITQRVVIDHNSFTFGIDESVEIYRRVLDLTMSNCLFGPALDNSIHSETTGAPFQGHSKHLLIPNNGANQQDRITIARNLLYSAVERCPRGAGGNNVEFVNNYVYGCRDRFRASDVLLSGTNYAFVKNVYRAAPFTTTANPFIRIQSPSSAFISGNLEYDVAGGAVTPEYYGNGTILGAWPSPSGLTELDAADVVAHCLANAGAFPPNRDDTDAQVISEVTAIGGQIYDSVTEFGGWRTPPAFTPKTDTDADGIPDEYEGTYATLEAYTDALLTGAATP